MICDQPVQSHKRTTSPMTSASFKAGMTKQPMIVAERSGANLLEYAFFPKNEFRSGEIIFDAALLPDPPEIPFDPFFQAYRWRITGVPDHGGIGYQMPDFTGPKLAIHNRR